MGPTVFASVKDASFIPEINLENALNINSGIDNLPLGLANPSLRPEERTANFRNLF